MKFSGGMRPMNHRQRSLFLILILAIVVLFVSGMTNYLLYDVAFEQNRERLVVAASSQARLIEAIAKHEVEVDKEENGLSDALQLVRDFYDEFEGFGETGEFVLARRQGEQIIFLYRQRRHGQDAALIDSELAVPMQQALSGQSGTLVGLDYRGRMVLAAFEPVAVLNLGVVAKIDLTEIRKPFVKSGIITGALAIIAIFAGAFLFACTTNPIFLRIQESESKYRDLVETSQNLIWRVDAEGRFTFLNSAWADTLGYGRQEMLSRPFSDFMPKEEVARAVQEFERFSQIESSKNFETAFLRKSGDEIILNVTMIPIFDAQGQIVGRQGTAMDITERKRAEQELRESRAQLYDAIESHPGSFAIYDAEDRLILCNSKTLEMFPEHASVLIPGARYEDLLRISLDKGLVQVDPEDRETYVQDRLKGLREKPDVIEQQWVDGSWYSVYHRPTSDGGTVSLRFDISERKRAEEHFRGLAEGSIQGILVHRNFKILFANQAMADLIGQESVADVLALDLHEMPFHAHQDRERTRNNAAARMRGESPPARFDMQAVKKDGTQFWMEVFATVVTWEGERAIQVTYTDITERKRVEAELEQKQNLLQTVFDTIPHWVVVKDTASNYMMVNKAFAESLGKTPAEVINFDPYELGFSKEAVEGFLKADRKVIESGQGFETNELEIDYVDGSKSLHHTTRLPIFDNSRNVVGVVVDIEDITERKQLEAQLLQAQKMEAVGVLAGGIAHDFNNILQPILAFSELLQAEFSATGDASVYIGHITRSAERAKDLVSKILLYSRHGESDKNPSNLVTVAEEVMGLMRSTLPKSINLELVSSDKPQLVLCDPSQIHQVLLNICINGAHAIAGQGDLKIEISNADLNNVSCVSGKKLAGKFVRIAVTDTGMGMGEQTLRKIFDPFYTTKGVGAGTGLGLSSALGIVQSNGGGIVVSTELGIGSTFEIFLPVFEVELKESPGQRTTIGGSESILLVDDEEAITRAWKIHLERLGYGVTAISDSGDALKKIKENPDRFDLVITDQSMPKMNGDILIQEMRKLNTKVPVILCTGLVEGVSAETIRSISINAILNKPLGLEEMEKAIRGVLDSATDGIDGKTIN